VLRKAQRAKHSTERRAWRAIGMALQGNTTAAAIAKSLQRSRPWFSKVLKTFQAKGLDASFAPKQLGRPSKLTEKIKHELRRGFANGVPISKLLERLRERNLNFSKSYLYQLRDRSGLAPSKPRRSSGRGKYRQSRKRLSTDVPASIQMLIDALLNSAAIPKGPVHKKLGLLWYLGLRQAVLKDVSAGRISVADSKALVPRPQDITAALGSSRRLVYEVCDAWNAAHANWKKFAQASFTTRVRKDIMTETGKFQSGQRRSSASSEIRIYLDDHCRIVLGRGVLRKEIWIDADRRWEELKIAGRRSRVALESTLKNFAPLRGAPPRA